VHKRTFTRAAGASPPWFGNVTFLQICDAHRQPHPYVQLGAAGVSPPWLGKRTCQYASAKSRESFNGAITNPGGVAVANPRAAYIPRSCVGVRMSAGEIAIFAVHKRMFSKSGGREPAVVRESHLQWRSVFVK
jgi:hypothetical protein